MAEQSDSSDNAVAEARSMNRRDFLKRSAVAATGMGALVAALAPLHLLDDVLSMEELL